MNRIERLSLKVLRKDKDALRRLAAAEGESMSVVVRRLIREAILKRRLWTDSQQEQETQSDGT